MSLALLRGPVSALVIASALIGMLPALPAVGTAAISVRAREVSVAVDAVQVVHLPFAASHVAIYWRGSADSAVTVAFGHEQNSFGQPIPVSHDEVGERRQNGITYGGVIAASGASFVRVASDRPIARLTVLSLDSRPGAPTAMSAAQVAAAAVDQPAVITRAGWGADESLRFQTDGSETWPRTFFPLQKLIVHHTASQNDDPDPAATMRSIYYYHAITQGWGDIGYNFLIDESGRIYEGRYSREYAAGESPTGEDVAGRGVVGAHVSGYNSGTMGVALLGKLVDRDATAASRDALERILAWKAERHAIDPRGSSLYTNPVSGTQRTFANISGHRDLAATECPGSVFYSSLPTLREAVARRISGPSAPTVPGAATLSAVARRGSVLVSWTVPSNGGSAITGYRIYRARGTNAPIVLASVGDASTSYVDSTTIRGRSYTYSVAALNAVGEGPRSNSVTVKAR